MTPTTPASGAADLLDLIEAYAEARHKQGHSSYNARTAATLQAVKDAIAAGQAPAGTTEPTEQQILEAAEKAGLWPNTVHSWIPAFHRYHKELAKAQPAPAQADSVQEDAARLDWLDQQCEGYGFQDIHEGNRWEISGPYANVRQAIDYERAARKQGATNDR